MPSTGQVATLSNLDTVVLPPVHERNLVRVDPGLFTGPFFMSLFFVLLVCFLVSPLCTDCFALA